MTASSTRVPWARPVLFGEEQGLVADALRTTFISGGPYVDRFEREFSDLHGQATGIAVCNGTAALHLALLGLGVGPGDEVIVPAWGFMAAANMAIAVGAVPVFADVDPLTWQVDPADVARRVTPRTKCVVPIHTYGPLADTASIAMIAREAGAYLVEDVAEAALSRRGGELAGGGGDASCFSFHATKTITTGEGGFVFARDDGARERMRLIRDHGMRRDRKYRHEVVGHNFRLTNFQAAMGCAQIAHWREIARMRDRVYGGYRERLRNAPVAFQHVPDDVRPVMWAIAVRLPPRLDRDAVMARMALGGVETRPGFCAASMQPVYRASGCEVAEALAREVIALPCAADLSDAELDKVCESLLAAIR